MELSVLCSAINKYVGHVFIPDKVKIHLKHHAVNIYGDMEVKLHILLTSTVGGAE
jgi:hypothetical protein